MIVAMRPSDIIVLHALRNDARLKHTLLAHIMDWPVSTTHERVKRCLKQYVTRSVALVDLARLGYTTRTLWRLRPHNTDAIAKHPATNTFSKLHTGDYLLETITATRHDEYLLGIFLKRHAAVLASHPVIEQLCVEKFLATPEYLPPGSPLAASLPDE